MSLRHTAAVQAAAILLALAVTASALTYRLDDPPPFASALLIEAQTGAVLFEYRADEPRSPASTQKLLLQLVKRLLKVY